MSSGFLWYGHFDKIFGYGEEAKQFVFSLLKNNICVKPILLNLDDGSKKQGEEQKKGAKATHEEFNEAYLKLSSAKELVTPDPYILVSHGMPPYFVKNPAASLNVARCMFETDLLPESWIGPCLGMDEVWVPSDFNLESFRRAGIPEEKLFKLPGTIDTDVYSPIGEKLLLPGGRKFKFLSVFEWSLRKGWDILVQAYVEEFSLEEPVVLIIKTWTTLDIDYRKQLDEKVSAIGKKEPPQIVLLDPGYLPSWMPSFYRGVDCFVLPSHGEGWGRPYMECMSCAIPVIGTGWSGNTEFMNSSNSFLLDHELSSVSEESSKEVSSFDGHRWANVDQKQLQEYMRYIYENQDEAQEIGARARQSLIDNFSYQKTASLLESKLKSVT